MPQGHFKSSTPDSKAAAILILATNSKNICVSSVVARPGFMLAVVARPPQKRKAEPRWSVCGGSTWEGGDFGEPDWQMLDSSNYARAQALDFTGQLDIAQPVQYLLNHHFELQSG
jgi:hypothetical protein